MLKGEGSFSEMLGLYFADRDQHFAQRTLQSHNAEHATSDLLYKGALKDSSRSEYSGLIKVLPGAQGTDAYQANRNLVLSDDAMARSIPQLEIEANEVRCTHGATVSPVEEEHLFYLMSRGHRSGYRSEADRVRLLRRGSRSHPCAVGARAAVRCDQCEGRGRQAPRSGGVKIVADFQTVATLDEIPDGGMRQFVAHGEPIGLYRRRRRRSTR